MSEMVERVAIAIWKSNPNQVPMKWEDCDENFRKAKRTQARAAIVAMRKPTTLMLIAAGRTDSGCELEFHDSEQVWQEMIDEALK